ncbi:GNAT family N-acetyltransferase [Sedimentibacter sp. zth1]|uniref:GNAT family N-acetyltransferase n=1 Tax=Sedimentibacter sp. zth1 TaxID=2816908 RepID=UPI001A9153C9|nr:GNAT family N-acetyltransferase [Sedimentibacter sp. zth1]QSX04681.1 GNAT family N-acetyltransferase [Sedimentibacter sp. zth1]
MITFGNGVVINATSNILPLLRDKLQGKTRYEVLNMPFVYGINPYYLPNLNSIYLLHKSDSFLFEFVEKDDISKLYQHKGFNYALQYDLNSFHTEHLAVIAKYENEIVGIASAVAECDDLWQINVDVLPSYRGNSIATTMVNMLTIEVLNRGKIPYYNTDSGNVISQRVAVKSGYIPTWSHSYRTRLDLL